MLFTRKSPKRRSLPYSHLVIIGMTAVALLIAAPFFKANVVLLLQLAVVYMLFATATNLLLGWTGLLSFGQAVFFGTGAYTVAILGRDSELPFALVVLLGALVPGLLALLIGLGALRTRKFYFGLLTLAFTQLFFSLSRQFYDLTGGDTGLFGGMVPKWLADPGTAFTVTVITVALCLGILWVISFSPYGQTLRAIKDNAQRARALGISVYRQELLAFTISGLFSGIAGVLFTIGQQAAYPTLLDWQTAGLPLFMALIGGMNSFIGPAIGAAVFLVGRQLLVTYTDHWQLFFGSIILLFVLFAPGGLAGLWGDLTARRTSKDKVAAHGDADDAEGAIKTEAQVK
ncbi:branched-chain amino acid ABC transporter permease [Tessaracoccus sp. MC1865]|uniref:branched-chain amino acid ABC transporter permease n=1 Tax=Tessaracoccus sp. MC1865 TaxID=2760310 RepID=UPI0016046CEB|nr:branched-chain amino acid ABC transporter permease [Tessaracoccus sp. MC1865]MBB1482611.1 branched-chain amino acid ABC transporter permease [Tessaracoccus sp. MC1865]QTO37938.1 branched-chain amino acid ABC transporter permease [Tessaracoccus sp. MC1865]